MMFPIAAQKANNSMVRIKWIRERSSDVLWKRNGANGVAAVRAMSTEEELGCAMERIERTAELGCEYRVEHMRFMFSD